MNIKDIKAIEKAAVPPKEELKAHLLKSIHDCGCPCHKQMGVMHCFPCCDACYLSESDVDKHVEKFYKEQV